QNRGGVMKNYGEISEKFRKFFQLPTSLVAVKISDRKLDGPSASRPSLFCEFVRGAAHKGELVSISETDLQNFTARVILGFTEPKYVDLYPRIKPATTQSVLVSPLAKIDQDPDVVIVITDPARMMEVLQVLHRATRKRLEASMTCEASAIAGEATAIPYMEKKPNLTLLCGGARTIAGYHENEMAMGIPYDIFVKLSEQLVEPTLATALCGCLMDDIPRHLKEAFIQLGFDKGTDHFYGEFLGKVFRIYLNKEERGFTFLTVHYPLKFKSEKDANEAAAHAKRLLSAVGGEATVMPRENWLDMILTFEFGEGLEKIATNMDKFSAAVKKILLDFSGAINKIRG
ncbi:MAG: DUF169 domain-containing protein, partial [Candidatus Hadarchaeota archaeon]